MMHFKTIKFLLLIIAVSVSGTKKIFGTGQMLARHSSKTFILVHGAWHGSWCWSKVAPLLQKMGHRVIAPDLPGHYHNNKEFKDITLARYVEHLENVVRQQLKPVVLVGHSMAGVAITQVAENVPHLIDHLIYTSAFIPENGGSLLEEEKRAAMPSVALAVTIDEKKSRLLLPVDAPDRISQLFYNCCSPQDAQYALSRLQPQPLLPFTGTITLSPDRFGKVAKLYIECLQDNAIMVQDQRRMHGRINCQVATLDTDHSPFLSTPDKLTDLICTGISRTPLQSGFMDIWDKKNH